jgi:hypothetical protein
MVMKAKLKYMLERRLFRKPAIQLTERFFRFLSCTNWGNYPEQRPYYPQLADVVTGCHLPGQQWNRCMRSLFGNG